MIQYNLRGGLKIFSVPRFVTGSLATCQEMISSGHSLSEQLRDKMKQVQNKWNLLKEEVRRRYMTETLQR